MNNFVRFLLYILAAYTATVAAAVIGGFAVGWLTRGVWRRTQALVEHTLGPRDEDATDDTDDDGLTAILDAIRDPDDGPTQELRPHPVYVGRRRAHRLSDSYINGEDLP